MHTLAEISKETHTARIRLSFAPSMCGFLFALKKCNFLFFPTEKMITFARFLCVEAPFVQQGRGGV